jgi:hypothetical protein
MIQVLDKHRDMYMRTKYGLAGIFGIPNLWLEVISPFLNMALLLITLLTWILASEYYSSLVGIILYLIVDVTIGIVALSLEPKPERRDYLAVPLLLFYNVFLDGIRIMSLTEEVVNIIMEWEKPKR